ncbi:hypothetical protein BDZ88DRAFT_434578 [Geranomyces variabilis]|nr:hypothetical protein BDZ88DRAFT_434578 [Geranomyces variabilis]KAJ3132442.1 hypothetical protein HDU90_006957 [Geranomyces variabilis]
MVSIREALLVAVVAAVGAPFVVAAGPPHQGLTRSKMDSTAAAPRGRWVNVFRPGNQNYATHVDTKIPTPKQAARDPEAWQELKAAYSHQFNNGGALRAVPAPASFAPQGAHGPAPKPPLVPKYVGCRFVETASKAAALVSYSPTIAFTPAVCAARCADQQPPLPDFYVSVRPSQGMGKPRHGCHCLRALAPNANSTAMLHTIGEVACSSPNHPGPNARSPRCSDGSSCGNLDRSMIVSLYKILDLPAAAPLLATNISFANTIHSSAVTTTTTTAVRSVVSKTIAHFTSKTTARAVAPSEGSAPMRKHVVHGA